MNQNLEEQKIRRLFRDARQADERTAPLFAETLEAAMSRAERRRPGAMFLRIAVAAATLVVVGVSAFVIFRQSATPAKIDPVAQGGHILRLPLRIDPVSPVVPVVVPSLPPIPPTDSKSTRHHPRVTPRRQSFEPSATLISQWQSPTDFLLTTPGEQLLKTVPRLRESSINFKAILPDEKN